MPYHWWRAEAVLEPAQKCFGQGNFGEQYQYLLIHSERGSERFEIGFGFARSGHPVEQERGEFFGLNRRNKAVRHFLLICAQGWLREIGIGLYIRPVDIDLDRLQRPLIDQPAQHPFADAGEFGQFADGRLLALQGVQRHGALRCHPFRLGPAQAVFHHRRWPTQSAARCQNHPRDRGDPRAVIIGRPFDQAA